MERFLGDVLQRHDTSAEKQELLSAIQHALPVFGAPQVDAWQASLTHYPDDLARAMVQRNLWFGPQWWPEMLAERDDYLALHHVYGSAASNIMASLMGLNRLYHPGRKWMDRTIEEMRFAPFGLSARLKGMFRAEPREGVHHL